VRRALVSTLLIVVLAFAAAGVAFLAGRLSADTPASYERGVDVGRAQTEAEYARGSTRFAQILTEGRQDGIAEGRRQGRAEGARKGRSTGRTAVFAGFEGGWQVGRWYLVNIAPADEGEGVGIGARITLRKAQWYGLCARPSGLCRKVGTVAARG
jgi:hypothetical protein